MQPEKRPASDLARTYGLKLAIDLPPPTRPVEALPARKLEYVDETPRRARRAQNEAAAEQDLDHHWVTVLTIEAPLPRKLGDNLGVLPVWVESNADWRDSGVAFDRQQPTARAVRLMVIGVPSATHAGRLKAALDEALHGCEKQHQADNLRYRFRNGVDFGDPDDWLTPLLQDALMLCEFAAIDFCVFTREEHELMIARRAQGRLRSARDWR